MIRRDATIWIITNQFGRRNLPDFVRVELALLLKPLEEGKAKERQGKRSDITPTLAECKETRQVIGDKAGVGKETVRKVENIKASGSPELVDFVRTGHVSINAAADIATLPKREQTELVAVEKKAILEAAKQIRNAKAIEKREDPS